MIEVNKNTFSKQISVAHGSIPKRVENVKPRLWLRIICWVIGYCIAALIRGVVLAALGINQTAPLGCVCFIGGYIADRILYKFQKKPRLWVRVLCWIPGIFVALFIAGVVSIALGCFENTPALAIGVMLNTVFVLGEGITLLGLAGYFADRILNRSFKKMTGAGGDAGGKAE